MPSVKEMIIRIVQDQPDDSTYMEIMREIAFNNMVERGLSDSDAGKCISNDEMGKRIDSWRR
ncbi:MAG TPA: hypothetical protein PK875_11040 [Spirochaetota bacterium]|nr:MAG: hypothetical protein BWY96_00866 [Spirochaetes bacterium ADurb.BinA120]HPI14533.1 hypothetical protein [Spirochaetota bacterium]HPO46317.1 hypothetical protein [Spirochaetota bacterium]